MLRTLAFTLLLVALLAVPAQASRSQVTYFEAPRDFLDAGTRDGAFDEVGGLGVHAVRIVMLWQKVAPDATSRRAEVRPHRSVGVRLGPVRRRRRRGPRPRHVRPAHRLGARPALGDERRTRQPHAPESRAVPQVHDGGGPPLRRSRVALLDLERAQPAAVPQAAVRQAPPARVAEDLPRPLPGRAARPARGGSTKPILFGETSPRGTGKVVAPLTFLRGALCLSSHYKRSRKCSRLDIDGYAHHAYTTRQGPFFTPPGRNDVTIGVLGRLTTSC